MTVLSFISMTSQWARWRLKSPASRSIVYSTIYLCTDQRKHQSSASLAFMKVIHRWPVTSPHKGPVARKMFAFDDVIIITGIAISGKTVSILIRSLVIWWLHRTQIHNINSLQRFQRIIYYSFGIGVFDICFFTASPTATNNHKWNSLLYQYNVFSMYINTH